MDGRRGCKRASVTDDEEQTPKKKRGRPPGSRKSLAAEQTPEKSVSANQTPSKTPKVSGWLPRALPHARALAALMSKCMR